MNETEITLKDVQRLRLNEGDTLVIRIDSRMLTSVRVEAMRASLEAFFPDNRVLLLDENMALEVVGPDEHPYHRESVA